MNQEQAFLQAFEKHAGALFRHCYYRVSDRERAVEIVQEAFTRTWDYIVKGNEVEEFKPFLYRTLNHLIIDEYRRKKPESLDALLDEADVPEGSFEELRTGGREDTEFSLDAGRVLELVEAMPNPYREVIILRYVDGLMPQEISSILNESVNLISVRIHRGLGWLRTHVDGKIPSAERESTHKKKTTSKKKIVAKKTRNKHE